MTTHFSSFPFGTKAYNPAMTAPPPAHSSKASSSKSLTTAKKPKTGTKSAIAKAGPRPRGVPWTNYTSKPVAAIDSSSSEEDSSDDDKGAPKLTGLAGLAQVQRPTIKQTERRGIKIFEPEGPGFKQRGPGARQSRLEQQAANSARLRGVQDFSHLHRQILQWDTTHDGLLPPGMSKEPPPVPSSFASSEDYFAAYEPLLLVECWEQLRQARQEAANETPPVPVDVAGRQDVDDFTDVFLTIEWGKMPDRFHFGESDLVLLRQGSRQTLAKIQSINRKREFIELTIRCHLGIDVSNVSAGLSARTKWEVVKLTTSVFSLFLPPFFIGTDSLTFFLSSLSTIHREYSALQTLRYLELCDDILSPRPPPRVEPDARTLNRTMQSYEVNEPQARAILGSLQNHGFSLIQGYALSTLPGLFAAS